MWGVTDGVRACGPQKVCVCVCVRARARERERRRSGPPPATRTSTARTARPAAHSVLGPSA
jgi:hypothetical protein